MCFNALRPWNVSSEGRIYQFSDAALVFSENGVLGNHVVLSPDFTQ